ncbi:MAG: DUF4345 domain-containing protein [Parvularculaceae bacterium]|nr:DUF4345 domain-containing protein [Parvularculaceae bacterium]
MSRIITRSALAASGAILSLIGGALMFAPRSFLEASHVMIGRDPGLLSELTAPSGVLMITGTFLLVAAVELRLANLALSLGAIVYGSYGLSRLVSMVLHGLLSQSLIAATAVELAIALVLLSLRNRHHSSVDVGLRPLKRLRA